MRARVRAAARRSVAGGTAALLAIGVVGLLAPSAARADSAPLDPTNPATPVTMTADGLPTVQINGVAWSQVVVGTTVYVAGSFSTARPAGAAPGTQETPRNNMLAYDIRTGNLITSFTPDLNGQALSVTASPDGSRVYVGGDFTTANGQPRNHVAAYDTATGALVSGFRPAVTGEVRALAATNTTVYMGGTITAVGTTSRTSLAAVAATDGALLPWAPVAIAVAGTGCPAGYSCAGSTEVDALVVTNGGSQVVAGGRFGGLNSTVASGVGALDATTGATKPFAVNQILTNHDISSGVDGLSTDGTTVYGNAWDYGGGGNLEGTFAATANGGALQFVAYCRGDNYSSVASNGALYIASHMHDCHYVDGYPDTGLFKRATAFGLTPTGKVPSDAWGNTNWVGKPTSSLLDWFPTVTAGTYTGQNQGGWSVVSAGKYLSYGGEFPKINGVGQQGLVRFAMPDIAPNKVGPDWSLSPIATAVGPGEVRLNWTATSDEDNQYLTYMVYRDSESAAPVYQVTQPSTWWNLPSMSFTDTGVAAGAHRYRVTATDPFGNVAKSGWMSATVATGGNPRPYVDAVHADGAVDLWSLGERTGTTAYDLVGTTDLTWSGGVTLGASGALAGDTDTATTLNSASSAGGGSAISGPQTFTVEAWFKATSTNQRIVGFGSVASGTSSAYDRLVYLDGSGRLTFGVYPGSMQTVSSGGAFDDGKWHYVAAELSSAGMALFADGQLVGSRTGITSAEVRNGFWRIGADNGWGGATSFSGSLDEVAVYPTALAAATIASHYNLGSTGSASNVPPTAAFTATAGGLTAAFDASASTDRDGTVASYAWNFGDGGTGSGVTTTHAYATPGTYQVTLRVTDDGGASTKLTQPVMVSAPPPNAAPLASFTISVGGRAVSVDASGSWDPDGSIVTYAWDFGDGTTGTGSPATHVYASDGTYTVTLTVTDNGGATGTTQQQVTVKGQPVLASDAFGREVASGWGTADVGGAWTMTGTAANAAVTGGAGQLTGAAGRTMRAVLAGVSAQDVAVQADVLLAQVPTGGTVYVSLGARRVGTSDYHATLGLRADGTQFLRLDKYINGVETTIVAKDLPTAQVAGQAETVRFEVSGTSLQAKVWPAGTAEPTAWTVTGTDTTAALQAPGGFAVETYTSAAATESSIVRVDNYLAMQSGSAAPVPANVAPTAAFTVSTSGLSLSVDGSTSSDPDGTVTSYAWDFGDGSTGSGATASHVYGTEGTYPVKLKVTDDGGATGTAQQMITVTAPGAALASDAFGRQVSSGWGTADVGGAWTMAGVTANASVTGAVGQLIGEAGRTMRAVLAGVSAQDTALQADVLFAQPATGGSTYVSLGVRRVGTSDYHATFGTRADGSQFIRLDKYINGVETTIVAANLAGQQVPGQAQTVRFEASDGGTGITALKVKVWPAGTTEPSAWTLTGSDSTADLQRPGGLMVETYTSAAATRSSIVQLDNLWGGKPGQTPSTP